MPPKRKMKKAQPNRKGTKDPETYESPAEELQGRPFNVRSPNYGPTSPARVAYDLDSYNYRLSSPTYRANSPNYRPTSPARYVPSPAYESKSPDYVPKWPTYKPTSPMYKPTSPRYKPTSLVYDPDSPVDDIDSLVSDLDSYVSDPDSLDEEDRDANQKYILPRKLIYSTSNYTADSRNDGPVPKRQAASWALGVFALYFVVTTIMYGWSVRSMKGRCADRDIYVVLGKTGVGKSTFIASLGARDRFGLLPQVCGPLGPCTTWPEYYEALYKDEMICLLEMPGFESDGQKVDEDILDQLRLALPVSQEVKGILYLHDISDAKLTGPSAKHMSYINRLATKPDRIVLVTTSGRVEPYLQVQGQEEKHIESLRTTYWRNMLQRGSRIMHFDRRSPASAWSAVEVLAAKRGRMQVTSMDEVVKGWLDSGIEWLQNAKSAIVEGKGRSEL